MKILGDKHTNSKLPLAYQIFPKYIWAHFRACTHIYKAGGTQIFQIFGAV